MSVEEHVTKVKVEAGRTKQLSDYEPIKEHTTIIAEVPEGADLDEFMENLSRLAWEKTEEGVTRRYEEHVRAEAFGED